MGFLLVNRKRAGPVSKKRKLNKDTSKLPVSTVPPIERLPRELLERVFLLSGNLDLPQTSLVLAQKLSRTAYLENQLILNKLDHEGKLPPNCVLLPFVTTTKLKSLQITKFVGNPPFVPLSLENKIEDSIKLELIAYMVSCGCHVEWSTRVYTAFANKNMWEPIEAMARSGLRAGFDVAQMAPTKELTLKLLKLCTGDETTMLKVNLLLSQMQKQHA